MRPRQLGCVAVQGEVRQRLGDLQVAHLGGVDGAQGCFPKTPATASARNSSSMLLPLPEVLTLAVILPTRAGVHHGHCESAMRRRKKPSTRQGGEILYRWVSSV